MAYSVIMLPAAEEDYREILRYQDRRFESPQAIRTLNQRLREALENLRETPRMYDVYKRQQQSSAADRRSRRFS